MSRGAEAPRAGSRNVEDVYPLSPMQQGMLFHSLYAPGSGVYITQLSCRLERLQAEPFARAWQALIDRHAILRTAFVWKNTQKLLQVVGRRVGLPLTEEDWRELPPDVSERRWQALLAADRRRDFDLAKAPLMRLVLVRVADGEHRFLWTLHHILVDGWCLSRIFSEVFALYEAFRSGGEPALPPPRPYRAYIEWLQQLDLRAAEGFWREALRGLRAASGPRVGPGAAGADADTAAAATETSRKEACSLSRGWTAAAEAFARRHRLTMNTLCLGGWALLLSRYDGEPEAVFGTVVSGRPPDLPGIEEMIGPFINTLPLRVRVPGAAATLPWLEQIQQLQVAMRQFEHTPLTEIQRWSEVPAGQPLFESLLAFENYPYEPATEGASVGVKDVSTHEQTNFPLSVSLIVSAGRLAAEIRYQPQRFERAAVARMLRHLGVLLEGLIGGPELPLDQLRMLSSAETHQLEREWNDTAASYPRRTLHELFAAQAQAAPGRPALRFGERELGYGELERRSNQLARHLRALGVGAETAVGLCLWPDVELGVGVLGILKAGGAYVPLDAAYPPERLALMAADAGVAVVLTQESLLPRLSGLAAAGVRPVALDAGWAEIARLPAAPLGGASAGALSLAYVTYTSGSTGRPKGIGIPHGAVCRLVLGADYLPFGPGERLGQAASISFDAATFELWGALLHGGTVVGVARETALSPAALAAQVGGGGITALFLTTALFNQVVRESPGAFAPLRHLLFGGEAVDPACVAAALAAGPPGRLLHVYGPTESTTFATWHRVEEVAAGAVTVPIGRPLANTRAYVVDPAGRPVPIGVAGELWLGGDGLARGYVGQPELTAAAFVPDGFGGVAGGRLYRTGDQVRQRADGCLEFLGRRDGQVKVRGFRIELGEIEAALAAAPGVRDCAVLLREDGPGERRLVACVVTRPDAQAARPAPAPGATAAAGPDAAAAADQAAPPAPAALPASALREHLRRRLPEHMVPSLWYGLEALPLNANGKVDRAALERWTATAPAAPAIAGEGAYTAPRTPLEELLAGTWAQLLGVERVGVDDGFFELGGHSLLATRLASRVREVLGVELPLRELFAHPTLGELAAWLEDRRRGGEAAAPPILPVPRRADLPLSFAQERLWFLQQLEPASAVYNLPASVELRGELHPAALAAALREVVARHEALRTRFSVVAGAPAQCVAPPPPPMPLPAVDLRTLPGGRREGELGRLEAADAARPFDLARGPLLRAMLVFARPRESALVLCVHHVAADGWSLGVLLGEVGQLYAAAVQGLPSPLPALPVQYADFAAWQRRRLDGPLLDRLLAFWGERLGGELPQLDLPLDRPRPPVQTYRGAECLRRLPAELAAELRVLSRREGATLFMTLLAAFGLLLGRASGQEDVLVGSPIAGRERGETEGLIGCFLNTLVLRADLGGRPSFRELLGRVREQCLGAYAHQELPFERLLQLLAPERDLSRTPLFQVFFNMLNFPRPPMELPGLRLAPRTLPAAPAKFDQTLYLAEEPEGLLLRLAYNADLFDAARIDEQLAQYELLLRQAAAAPESGAWEMPLLTAAAAALLPDPAAPLSAAWEGAVHDLFAAWARRAPASLAAADAAEAWSYRDLDERSDRLAAWLRAGGVRPGDVVALWAHRSAPLVWGVLGALKAGAAFLMLDPRYPAARQVQMLRLASPRAWLELQAAGPVPGEIVALLAELGCACRLVLRPRSAGPGELGAFPAATGDAEAQPAASAVPGAATGDAGPRLAVSAAPWAATGDAGPRRAGGAEPAPPAVGPDSPAYVAFTSGSTGVPKGVVGRHGSLSHFLPWLRRRFALSPGDRYSMLSGLAHDPLHRDLFTPLATGAAVLIPDPERLEEPGWLGGWLRREGVTVAHLTPALGQLLTAEAEGAAERESEAGSGGESEAGPPVTAPSLRWIFLVGDVLTRRDVARLRRLAPAATCVNYYGSTETQRAVGYHVAAAAPPAAAAAGLGAAAAASLGAGAAAAKEILPLGRGIPDVQLLVRNRAGALAGVGELGEISVRSPHLALGYLGDPELTAQRFPVNPATGQPQDRLYRTGDLGRYLPDGEVVFAGRADTQVKIRGFRVELGEIESVLGGFPGVRDAVVVARRDGGAAPFLAAYVVPAAGATLAARELRGWLRERLPDYMVPGPFVLLGELPLTPNRKVDRRALPAPPSAAAPGDGFVPPEGPVQELLAELWSELLGVARVGAADRFFDLGGHSLLASRLLSRIRAVLGVELPLRRIFELATLRDLAAEIGARRAAAGEGAAPAPAPAPPLRRVPRGGGGLPLSFAQQRLWLLDQLDPGTAAYVLAAAVRLDGPLAAPALAAALAAIVRRHEVLRSTYAAAAGAAPADAAVVQRIAPPGPVPLPVVDLAGLPAAARAAAVRRLARAAAGRPFDLTTGPVLRTSLLRLARGEHVLLLALHHVAADGWSLAIFVRELSELYDAAAAGRPARLPELPVQYADFAAWQRGWLAGEALAAEVEHWRRALAGAPPLLELPPDRPRPAVQSLRGARRSILLEQRLAAALEGLARRHGATLYMVLAAGWAALLARLSGAEDLCVGTPVANRHRPELEGLIGCFANTLVLRFAPREDASFAALAASVRETCLEAFGHQELPFEKLVEELAPRRSLSHSPLFQVFFALQNAPAPALAAAAAGAAGPTGLTGLAGLSMEPLPVDGGAAKFDLSLSLAPDAAGLHGTLEYCRDLFDAATMDRLLGRFRALLETVARQPEARLAELPPLGEVERQQLREWSATAVERPPGLCLHHLCARQAALQPAAVAVADLASASLTYGELEIRANRLANHLVRLGVGPETLVGVALERTPALPVALLAVLKAGGGYVPLDPDFPRDRLAWMMCDSGLRVLVTEEHLRSRFTAAAGLPVVLVDADAAAIAAEDAAPPAAAAAPPGAAGVAYVIYTSGSTGRPKGVQVLHGAVVNCLLAMSRRPGLTAADALLAVTTLSFDIAVVELFLPLVVGGRVVIAPREVASDGERLAAALAGPGLTALQATPAGWRLLLDAGWTGRAGFKALCGGEALPRDLADRLLGAVGELWNVYGPTETTIWSTAERVTAPGAPIAIGRPFDNTRTWLLSRAWEPVPVGAAGELCIGGAGLARGYLGLPELTAERFIPCPEAAGGEACGRLYRTGDLARQWPDGRIECLGRLDAQLKVRGFRIEPGEIEHALAEHPAVRQAVVAARRQPRGDPRLVAYVVPAAEVAPSSAELRSFLALRLPDYMVPGSFTPLAALPMTPNGKVDRRSLPEPRPAARAAYLAPRTALEAALADTWREVLGVETVGVDDDFFDLGGHSLSAVQAAARIRGALDVDVQLRHIFQFPTVAKLAEALAERPETRERVTAAAALMSRIAELSEVELDALLGDEAGQQPAEPRPAGGAAAGPLELETS